MSSHHRRQIESLLCGVCHFEVFWKSFLSSSPPRLTYEGLDDLSDGGRFYTNYFLEVFSTENTF